MERFVEARVEPQPHDRHPPRVAAGAMTATWKSSSRGSRPMTTAPAPDLGRGALHRHSPPNALPAVIPISLPLRTVTKSHTPTVGTTGTFGRPSSGTTTRRLLRHAVATVRKCEPRVPTRRVRPDAHRGGPSCRIGTDGAGPSRRQPTPVGSELRSAQPRSAPAGAVPARGARRCRDLSASAMMPCALRTADPRPDGVRRDPCDDRQR
jgi:hypothetical protein